jgi:predicted ester cyclase
MSKKETATAFLEKINNLDLNAASQYCTDDFTYSGPLPKPVTLDEWKVTAQVFLKAFPDWNFNMKIVSEDDDRVQVNAHVTGTHRGDLDLSSMDMGVIPATGKAIDLPESKGRVTFSGDKIANLHIDVAEGAGVPGILAQLGVSKPSE